MGHLQINNSDPRIIVLGFLVAAICGVLGAVAFIHSRDRAAHNDGHYDRLTPQHSVSSGNNLVGGIRLIFLCLVLGCAVIYLLKSEPQRLQLIQKVSDAIGVNTSKNSRREPMHQMPPRGYSDKWVNHQWTADEAPYLQIRNEVDSQMTTDKESARASWQAMDAAFRDPNNPLAMYRWGYIAYKMAYEACYHSTSKQRNERVQGDGRDARHMEISRALRNVDYRMQQVENPQSYSYSRLIFLLKWMRGFAKPFSPLARFADVRQGEYLVRYKPHDWDVKQALAQMLATRRDAMSIPKAMDYAQEVVRARPQSPQAWQTLGMVYVCRAQISKRNPQQRSEDITKGIEAYRKCLRLAPPDYGPRESLEKAIPTIRERLQ